MTRGFGNGLTGDDLERELRMPGWLVDWSTVWLISHMVLRGKGESDTEQNRDKNPLAW